MMRGMSLLGSSPRHYAWATQLLSKKFCSGGEPLQTLCRIKPARELNLRPLARATNAFSLDQVAGWSLLFNDLAVVMPHCQFGNRNTGARKLSSTVSVKLSYIIRGITSSDRVDI